MREHLVTKSSPWESLDIMATEKPSVQASNFPNRGACIGGLTQNSQICAP